MPGDPICLVEQPDEVRNGQPILKTAKESVDDSTVRADRAGEGGDQARADQAGHATYQIGLHQSIVVDRGGLDALISLHRATTKDSLAVAIFKVLVKSRRERSGR